MGLREELLALEPFWKDNSGEFEKKVQNISERYNSDADKKIISEFIDKRLSDIDSEINELEKNAIKLQLEDISEIISLSYIAKLYFGRSRNWSFQRIHNYNVNGKPARFSEKDIEIFNAALKDISNKIGSISLSAK